MKGRNNKGLTLIEVVLAIMLLSLIVIAMLPMIVQSTRFTINNTIKTQAMNLAYNQLEWIKTLNYDQVGLEATEADPIRNVKGIIKEDKYMNNDDEVIIDNVIYKIDTEVNWKLGVSHTGETVPNAKKNIRTTVTARSPLTGRTRVYSEMSTIISFEGERDPVEEVYLKVITYLRGVNLPEEERFKTNKVKIETRLASNGSLVSNTYTDENGEVFIGGLLNRDYSVEPIEWDLEDIAVHPSGKNASGWTYSQRISIPPYDPRSLENMHVLKFYVDHPGYIKIPIYESLSNGKITLNPQKSSYSPPDGQAEDFMEININLNTLNTTKLWRLWSYDYSIKYGSYEYFLGEDDGSLWNGSIEVVEDNPTIKNMDLYFIIRDISYSNILHEEKNLKKLEIDFTSELQNIDEFQLEIDNSDLSNFSKIYSMEDFSNVSEDSYFVQLNHKQVIIHFYDPSNSLNITSESSIIIKSDNIIDVNGIKYSNDILPENIIIK